MAARARAAVSIMALVTLAAACSVDAVQMMHDSAPTAAVAPTGGPNDDQDKRGERITFEELTDAMTDPDAEIEFEEIDGVDLESLAPDTDDFCEAFAAAELTWLDGAIVPLQMLHDAWEGIEPPAELAADVEALRSFTQDRIDWNFGRIDRELRPTPDLAMFERLERIADAAVASCDDLPIRLAWGDDWAAEREWDTAEIEQRCAESRATIDEGIALYREQRGREPGHNAQIELAALVEWYRSLETVDGAGGDAPLWFSPELHGPENVDGAAVVRALPPCDES